MPGKRAERHEKQRRAEKQSSSRGRTTAKKAAGRKGGKATAVSAPRARALYAPSAYPAAHQGQRYPEPSEEGDCRQPEADRGHRAVKHVGDEHDGSDHRRCQEHETGDRKAVRGEKESSLLRWRKWSRWYAEGAIKSVAETVVQSNVPKKTPRWKSVASGNR